ncbi:MAG: OmpW family outer membrane protein [Longimicrobiales bacterium]|nr:OmpW family outer membrane protein [Longimicrobiales bacterium]
MGSSTLALALRTPLIVAVALGLALSAVPLEAQGPWQFRLRGIGIFPDEDASITPIGGDVDIDEAFMPELDISYFLTPNLALELILATSEHDVKAEDTDIGDVDIGSVWLLPPTLLLQYHIAPNAPIRPYVGAGLNLTIFYSEDVPGTIVTDADYDTAAGAAFQAGFDIPFAQGSPWMFNVDAKKLLLDTDVSLNGGAVTADVDIDPWIISFGIGYRPGG